MHSKCLSNFPEGGAVTEIRMQNFTKDNMFLAKKQMLLFMSCLSAFIEDNKIKYDISERGFKSWEKVKWPKTFRWTMIIHVWIFFDYEPFALYFTIISCDLYIWSVSVPFSYTIDLFVIDMKFVFWEDLAL